MQNLGCVTEENIDYWGSDVSNWTSTPDVASCRSTCNSLGARYFAYIISNSKCWCKDSNAGRTQQNNRVSGETCLGEFKIYILNLLITTTSITTIATEEPRCTQLGTNWTCPDGRSVHNQNFKHYVFTSWWWKRMSNQILFQKLYCFPDTTVICGCLHFLFRYFISVLAA